MVAKHRNYVGIFTIINNLWNKYCHKQNWMYTITKFGSITWNQIKVTRYFLSIQVAKKNYKLSLKTMFVKNWIEIIKLDN